MNSDDTKKPETGRPNSNPEPPTRKEWCADCEEMHRDDEICPGYRDKLQEYVDR